MRLPAAHSPAHVGVLAHTHGATPGRRRANVDRCEVSLCGVAHRVCPLCNRRTILCRARNDDATTASGRRRPSIAKVHCDRSIQNPRCAPTSRQVTMAYQSGDMEFRYEYRYQDDVLENEKDNSNVVR